MKVMETEIEVKWSKHAVVRAYKRFGRYGLDNISKKIIKSLSSGRIGCSKTSGSAMAPIKLGKKRCVAVVQPISNSGDSVLVKTIYELGQDKHRVVFRRSKKT